MFWQKPNFLNLLFIFCSNFSPYIKYIHFSIFNWTDKWVYKCDTLHFSILVVHMLGMAKLLLGTKHFIRRHIL